MFYQTTLVPPGPVPPEDVLYWVFLGLVQIAVVVLVLLRRRGLR